MEFEDLFPSGHHFAYFPNFRRIRVQFDDSVEACRARVRFHLFEFHGNKFRTYLTNQAESITNEEMNYLKVSFDFEPIKFTLYSHLNYCQICL